MGQEEYCTDNALLVFAYLVANKHLLRESWAKEMLREASSYLSEEQKSLLTEPVLGRSIIQDAAGGYWEFDLEGECFENEIPAIKMGGEFASPSN